MTDEIENQNMIIENNDMSENIYNENPEIKSISVNTKVDEDFEYVTYKRKKKSDTARRNIADGQRRRWLRKKEHDEKIIREKKSLEDQLESKIREIAAIEELLKNPTPRDTDNVIPVSDSSNAQDSRTGARLVDGRIIFY